jgi:hypothetical protein
MSTPLPASQLPTRQQLDEIDSLLRRMLTLPPLAGDVAEAPPVPTYPSTIREVPPAQHPAPGEPVVQAWRVEWPQSQAAAPSVVAWGTPALSVGEPPAATYASPPAPAPVAQPVSAPPAPVSAPIPASLWPLLALNGAFDVLTYLLGPIGTWLRGPGRTAIGLTGVLMILAATTWAVGEWYGYDWPKVDVTQLSSRLGLAR